MGGSSRSIATALARIDGRSVGIIANNPMFKGGAIDVDACRKAVSFMVLCDSFNLPLIFLTDQPGFLIGIEGELRGAPGLIMNWMNALSLVTVPKLAVMTPGLVLPVPIAPIMLSPPPALTSTPSPNPSSRAVLACRRPAG